MQLEALTDRQEERDTSRGEDHLGEGRLFIHDTVRVNHVQKEQNQ